MSVPPTHHSERSGLLLALAGFVLLSLGDAVVKSMAGQWAPTAIATLRYAIGASVLSALLLWRQGRASFAMPRPGLQLMRGAAVGVSTIAFFAALALMPLAEATTIVFASPIFTALLAPIFLKERATSATWIAAVMAFVGVGIVLRPNLGELGAAALLPLLAALSMSVLLMGNRAVAGSASALAMQAFVALSALPILFTATLLGHFSGMAALAVDRPSAEVVAKCAVVACTATSGHWLIYLGITRAGAAPVAPMTYVQLIVAIGLGWLWFGDRPDAVAMAGAAVIMGAGLILWRAGSAKPAAPKPMDSDIMI